MIRYCTLQLTNNKYIMTTTQPALDPALDFMLRFSLGTINVPCGCPVAHDILFCTRRAETLVNRILNFFRLRHVQCTFSGTIIVDILVVKLGTSGEYIITFQFSFIHDILVFYWYNILRYAIDRKKYLRNIYLVWGRYHFVHVGNVKCKQGSSNIGRPFLIGLTGHY